MAPARRRQLPLDQLTPRQSEVLGLMAQGRSNTAIARALVISEHAVVQHTSQIYDQLPLAPITDDHRRGLTVLRFLNDTADAG